MALQDTGIFIASSLIADTPDKDKENAEPTGDTPAGGKGPRSGESGSRYGRVFSCVVGKLLPMS